MNAWKELTRFLSEDCGGEAVESVVFGDFDYCCDNPKPPFGKLMRPDEASTYCGGWEFAGGFGTAGCYPMVAWTASYVIFVSEYDGSTRLESLPRNPIACNPVHI